VLVGFALQALVRDAQSNHFEGFVLIVSFVIVIQGGLMLAYLGRGGAADLSAKEKANR
jgi:hypothetical protein